MSSYSTCASISLPSPQGFLLRVFLTGVMEFAMQSTLESSNFTMQSGVTYERVYVKNIDMASARHARIWRAVKKRFGITLHPFQVGAIADILDRDKDVFVIAGTSAGKSMVYQGLPVMEKEMIVLVISPTIALMTDQVNKMRKRKIDAVALTKDTVRNHPRLWNEVEAGKYPVVLASPEILLHDGSYFWMNILSNKRCKFCQHLGVLVIDECHLLWGWREFRKDYLALRTLRAHFPRLPFVALTATATPKVFGFVVKTACLRESLRLYKLSIDRPNITHLVAQIDPQRGYAHFGCLTATRGGPWRIPKSMIFVDSIDECTQITKYIRELVVPDRQENECLIVRPFHASLEGFLRSEYLESFMNGDTRILVCTDAAGMGVDIGDVEIVMQWKIARHTTLATLWQRFGRAGRDKNIAAISVLWVEARHLLPATIPAESVWVGFDSAVSEDTIKSSTEFVRNIYRESDAVGDEFDSTPGATAYHRIDPSLLWYINTKGCRARCILSAFCDRGAYSPEVRQLPCCDNCFYSPRSSALQIESCASVAVDGWMRKSIRFSETEDSQIERTIEQMRSDQQDNEQPVIKTSTAQELAVNETLNKFANTTFGNLHRLLFPPDLRRRIASVAARCISAESLAKEINRSTFNLENSTLSIYADEIVLSIAQAAENVATNIDTNGANHDANHGLTRRESQLNSLHEPESPQIPAIEQPSINIDTLAPINMNLPTADTDDDTHQTCPIIIPESVASAIPQFHPSISAADYHRVRNELLNDPGYQFTNSIRSPLAERPLDNNMPVRQQGEKRKRNIKDEEDVARSKVVRRAERTELTRQKHSLKMKGSEANSRRA